MIKTEDVRELVEKAIEGQLIFLVELSISFDNRIEVTLDSMSGVTLDDCVNVSRFIESNLDREVEDYELVVSSAGIGQPFKLPQQYQKNLGKEVEVLLKSGTKLKGILKQANEGEIALEHEVKELLEGKKRKQLVVKSDVIKIDDIKATKLIVRV